jgi:NAD(P)H-dependent flavin oxidoreductase YrpB (nitropropane dioxygenase family)
MVTGEAVARTTQYAAKAQDVLFNPVGQIVGQMQEVRPVREVIQRLVEEYVEATDRLDALNKV